MAKKAVKRAAKKIVKKTTRRKAGQRDLVRAPNATFFATRNDDGSFQEMDEIGRSLTADRRRTAKRTVPAGFGDQGDQPKRTARKASKKTVKKTAKAAAATAVKKSAKKAAKKTARKAAKKTAATGARKR